MTLKGSFSIEDEQREDAIEKATFMYPASNFGQAAESAADIDRDTKWDWLTKQMVNINNGNSIVVDGPRVISTVNKAESATFSDSHDSESDSQQTLDAFDVNIDGDGTDDINDSLASKVDLTDKSLRTNVSVVNSAMSVTSTSYAQPHLPTFVPNPDSIMADKSKSKYIKADTILRPKKAFRGRAFPSFGNLIKPLHGTMIFPLSPKQEKLYFKVATNSPIDHYDGDQDQSFMDNIKLFMTPILESIFPSNQTSETFLCRRRNIFKEDWESKFPLASNRWRTQCRP